MNIAQIESNLQQLILNYTKDTFIYELLLAYGLPKASITRLQKGNLNLSKIEGEVSWKKKLFFKPVYGEDLHLVISEIKNTLKQDQRFVIITDFITLLAIDTKNGDTLDIAFNALPTHFDFFLPWAGMEKAQHQNENPADVKAAEKMAKLFDEIRKDNPDNSPEFIHGLNVFLSRLLFCFFAEDTGIFKLGQFTNALASHTQTDGEDLNSYLDTLYNVLNMPQSLRTGLPAYLNDFPYVNGGLFKDKHPTPIFTRRSRQAIIDAGELNWSAINPDIFGSMFQAVITSEHRGGLGAHYTSVPNIMKVISPLFLDDLYEEFEKGKYEPKKLNKLLDRISKIKIFDPGCGSGNFLIIAYKELRILEIRILEQLQMLQKAATGFEEYQLELIPKAQLTLAAQYQHSMFSRVELSQFYGIEIDDFAHEIAILSLWLAQHQMNQKFKEVFGSANPTLPLQAGGNIIHANATRIDWEAVCPKNENDEIYILGNPPYLGYALQSLEQKNDMAFVFKKLDNYKKLDFIACWFYLGAKYINGINAQYAFVSTNSVCQGEQVAILWQNIFDKNLEIGFAYQSFKWKNNAKANAGVAVVIIGIRNKSLNEKRLYLHTKYSIVKEINSYLVASSNIIVESRNSTLSDLPEMIKGSSPGDNGNLLLDELDKENLIRKYPELKKIIRMYLGASEFMNGNKRYAIWVNKNDIEFAYAIPELFERFEKCKEFRLNSTKEGTRKKALTPHEFDEKKYVETNSILVPQTGSERREYLPIGFLNSDTIISNAARVIYNAEPFLFSLISSRIHIQWVRAVAGRLKTDMQYSNTLCYNTFPFPPITDAQKEELNQCVFRILEQRENHSEKTLAQLYDPDKMPEGLREAHRLNDLAVERCYRSKPFDNDEERLEYLFKLYEKMIAEEKEKDTLFAGEKKTRKKK